MARGIVTTEHLYFGVGSLACLVIIWSASADAISVLHSSNLNSGTYFAHTCHKRVSSDCQVDSRDHVYGTATSDSSRPGSCVRVQRKYCLSSSEKINCCTDIRLWSLSETCFHYSRPHYPFTQLICQLRRRHWQDLDSQGQVYVADALIAAIPKGASQLAIYWNSSANFRMFVRSTGLEGEITNTKGVTQHDHALYTTSQIQASASDSPSTHVWQTLSKKSQMRWGANVTVTGVLSLVYMYRTEISLELPSGSSGEEICHNFLPFKWKFSGGIETSCLRSCGSSQRLQKAQCSLFGRPVPDGLCCQPPVPPVRLLDCSAPRVDCQPSWTAGSFDACNVSCGEGGTRFRSVLCTRDTADSQEEELNPDKCNRDNKPAVSEPCRGTMCSAIWKSEEWEQCNSTCFPGVQRREVHCRFLNGSKAPETECSIYVKPSLTKQCGLQCNSSWHSVTDWNECDGKCNGMPGQRFRSVRCEVRRREADGRWKVEYDAPHRYCDQDTKLPDSETCLLNCSYWKVVSRSQCSGSCSESYTTQRVECVDQLGEKSSLCSEENKPSLIVRCQRPDCPQENLRAERSPWRPPRSRDVSKRSISDYLKSLS